MKLTAKLMAIQANTQYPSVIFVDLDGVLADTREPDKAVHHHLASLENQTIDNEEAAKRSQSYLLTRPTKKLPLIADHQHTAFIEEKIAHILEWNRRYYQHHIPIFDEVISQLEQLQELMPEVPIVIMTNAHSEYAHKYFGVNTLFDDIVCADHHELGELKSCRMRAWCEQRSFDFCRSILITDGPNDAFCLEDHESQFPLENCFVVGWGILGDDVFDHIVHLPVQHILKPSSIVGAIQSWVKQQSVKSSAESLSTL